MRCFLVELAGFEPASKQANYQLSTCVVNHWFSRINRGKTPNLILISLISHKRRSSLCTNSLLTAPHIQTGNK